MAPLVFRFEPSDPFLYIRLNVLFVECGACHLRLGIESLDHLGTFLETQKLNTLDSGEHNPFSIKSAGNS